MCGLVGILGLGGRVDLPGLVERMSGAVAHRGPDDSGSWVDPDAGIALAHRRLAVVDLSPTGHQPMVSADGRWVLVFNGEIYDHAEHRRILAATGGRLRGTSDTEVLLELIARWGPEEAFTRVDGMFALAVWDRRERQLVLARDRLGEKPLYYGKVGGLFAVASELTALRRLPAAPREPDPVAVAEFLRWGFVPAPLSILPGIHKLPAGSILRVDSDGHPDEPLPYWSLAEVARAGLADPLDLPDTELVDMAEDLLTTAVARRLEADVPVGAFLSGGVDSSTIVALAQATSTQSVRTYTVAVGGAGDEADAAAHVAKHLGTDHTTLPLAESAALELAPRVAQLYDEPFADPSAIPTSLLCAEARRRVTVCISGDGADELLAGYNRYRVASDGMQRLLRIPGPARRGLGRAAGRVSPKAWDRLAKLMPGGPPAVGDKIHKLSSAVQAGSPFGAYERLATVWDPAAVLSEPEMVGASSPGGSWDETRATRFPGAADLDRMLLTDQERTLPDDMLVKVDRASMAVALEVRVPFLDHRFTEFTWRLPARAKVRAGQGKWLVREVLARHVPDELWDRPKVGFDPPLAAWLRGPLRDWSHDLLAPDRLREQGLLRPAPVQRALADHLSGRRNMDYRLWTLLMLQSWLDDGAEVGS